MENRPPPPTFESEPQPEHSAVNFLPEALGYVETGELVEVAEALVRAMQSGAETKELARHYLDHAEVTADQSPDEHARLGLEIRLALLRRAGGRVEAYLEDIEDAAMHAAQMGLEEVAAILDAELA